MILARDILAAITLIWISSSAWDERATDNSIAASVRLAFYLPRSEGATHPETYNIDGLFPAVLDVDGDGSPEALAMWRQSSEVVPKTDGGGDLNVTGWKVEILDLRQSLTPSSPGGAANPFRPKVLLESKLVEGKVASVSEFEAVPFHPLKMVTGQVLTSNVRPTVEKKAVSASSNKTLQYFCGKDWHDAAHKCSTHCPSGHSSDCPEGETCYADTPCSAATVPQDHGIFSTVDSLHKTPAGGWPSMFTAWSQGRVTMHSLTAENLGTNETTTGGKANRRKNKNSPLQLILLWDSSPFLDRSNESKMTTTKAIVEWEYVDLTFVDAMSAPEDQGSNAGMLLVTGTAMVYRADKSEENHDESHMESGTFVLALDAFTGKTLWRSSSSAELERALFHHDEPEVLLPVVPSRGSTSVARRRSLVPGLDRSQGLHSGYMGKRGGTSTINCMKEYRRSLLTSGALPYQYWGADDDTSVVALHFDHQSGGSSHDHDNGHHNGKAVKTKAFTARKTFSRHVEPSAQGKGKSRWLSSTFSRKKHKHRKAAVHLGRPNVVVTHNFEGIQVRALRNGRSLCHLSLTDHSLYADVNHDGTLDSLQVIVGGRHTSFLFDRDDDSVVKERKWVEKLARRVTKMNDKNEEDAGQESLSEKLQQTPLCHILALSGLPTREELYSANLCAGRNFDEEGGREKDINSATDAAAKQLEMQGAPLLLVEGMGNSGVHGHDVIAAINTGTVSRFRGDNGRRVWQWNERRFRGETFPTWDDAYSVKLARIDADNVILSARPVVLVGENSVALFAASSGHLLATSKFPQPSITRPRLVDLNGDGTTDLLVSTNDAIWGYHIVVRTGTSIPVRIIVGLLMMGLMLALVRNRFGPQPGKRSTDR